MKILPVWLENLRQSLKDLWPSVVLTLKQTKNEKVNRFLISIQMEQDTQKLQAGLDENMFYTLLYTLN